jgi:hypothetical protein
MQNTQERTLTSAGAGMEGRHPRQGTQGQFTPEARANPQPGFASAVASIISPTMAV